MGYAEERPCTLDEFLEWERAQPERFEYLDGVVRMMTGGTLKHRRIMGNLFRALANRLGGSACEAFVEGPKVLAEGRCMYPDVSVVCGDLRLEDDHVADAVLIAEVLSPTTADRDRGGKWGAYQALPSLQHYLLVAQDVCRIDMFSRSGDGWRLMRYVGPDQSLPLTALGIDVPLAEIYRGTVAAAPTSVES